MSFEEDNHYSRDMFFTELSESIERNKLSTNVLFSNYLNNLKDIVQHNGLIKKEMNIVCQLLCTVDLSVQNVKQILLILVPKEPSIPSDVCEELIVLALSLYRQNNNDETKAQLIFYWLLYVVEEKLTDIEVIDKYYKILFNLTSYQNLIQPISGIIYFLTKCDDVQKWMITSCKSTRDTIKNQPYLDKLINFFENPCLIHETRQKKLFDNNTKFHKELARGLRSVRKELIQLRPQSTSSHQLIEYGKRNSNEFYNKIQMVSVNNNFKLPSFHDVAKAFIKQDIPNNSLALLNDVSGWLQLLTNENKELNLQNCFITNLYNSLDKIFFSNKKILTSSETLKFLEQILEFQKFAQRGLIAINIFIFKYMLSWDGMEYDSIIYELFEYLSFTSEEELKISFLEKLHDIFITGDELIYKTIISSLTNLLCRLHLNKELIGTNKCVLFGRQLRDETKFEIVKCLTKYISHLCSLCVYHYPLDDQLKNTVYTFFEKVSVLENLKPYTWPLWTIMPPNVFYNGLMSINLYWLNRLAKLMLRYIKEDIIRIEKFSDTPWILKASNMFNLYMADLYNALQTGELFEKRHEGFIFKNLNIEDVQRELNIVNLNVCFQLENHIALAPYLMKVNNMQNPLDLLEIEAPNLHLLILSLRDNLCHTENDKSAVC